MLSVIDKKSCNKVKIISKKSNSFCHKYILHFSAILRGNLCKTFKYQMQFCLHINQIIIFIIVHYDTCDLNSTFLHGVKLGPGRSEFRRFGHFIDVPHQENENVMVELIKNINIVFFIAIPAIKKYILPGRLAISIN